MGLSRLDGGDAGPGGRRLLPAALRGRLRGGTAPDRGRMPDGGGGLCNGSRTHCGRRGLVWAPAMTRSASSSAPGRGCARTRWPRGSSAARSTAASSRTSCRARGGFRIRRPRRGRRADARLRRDSRARRRHPPLRRSRRPGCVTGTRRAGVQAAATAADAEQLARPLRGRRRGWPGDPAAGAMRSPLAYTPRPGLLQRRLAGGRDRLPRRLRRRRLPLLEPAGARRRGGRGRRIAGLAGRRRPRRAASRCGSGLSLALLITSSTGWSPTAATPSWPASASGRCWARSNVTAEALAAGAVIGLRAMVGDDRRSPSTRPASIPTGCCGCCARSPAARR